MSADKEKNVIPIRVPTGAKVEIQPHPEEVIDVAPEILASMEARLRGESFVEIYGREDQVSDEFLLRKEVEKLRRVFTGRSVLECFQSTGELGKLKQALKFEDVNRQFLTDYSLRKSAGEFVDEADLYAHLLTGVSLITKKERIAASLHGIKTEGLKKLLSALMSQYLGENFEPLRVTKEAIQLDADLGQLFRSNQMVDAFNSLLKVFYGELK